LAYHWERTDDHRRAIDYLLQAGDRASQQYAMQEAIDFFERALIKVRAHGTDQEFAEVQLKLGLLYYALFDFERSQESFREGAELWQSMSQLFRDSQRDLITQSLRVQGILPFSIDPTVRGDPGSGGVINLLFSGLFAVRPDESVVPEIAQDWEILDGGRKVVFRLRDDALWSDGNPVTAQDFAFAWERTLDPVHKSHNATAFFTIRNAQAYHEGLVPWDEVGIRAENGKKLTVELEHPSRFFFYLMASPVAFPIPRNVVERYGENWTDPENLITNGPYKIKSYKPEEYLSVVLREDFYGRCSGNVRDIELIMQYPGSSGSDLYDGDKLDVFIWVHENELSKELKSRDDFRAIASTHFHYFTFDTSRKPFDDERVRKALVHAFDRRTLASEQLLDLATPASGGLIPPGYIGHSSGTGLAFNPERAKSLLADAGYPDGEGFPEIEAISLGRRHHDIGIETDYLQAQWNEHLGIDIVWNDLNEMETFLERVAGRPHVYHYGMMGAIPDSYGVLTMGPGESTWAAEDETYHSLLGEISKASTYDQRVERYRELDRYLIQSAMIAPITNYPFLMLVKHWVKQFPMVMCMPCWREIVVEPR
ncbi:MAG: ABC transporter substrate-binding protein, partial [Anaerolineales bacterium]